MSALYRELPAPDGLGALASCAWEHEADEARGRRIVPDGCVDLIWLAEQELVVAGPDTSAQVAMLPAGRRSSGIRLRPGAAAAVLGLPASELRDLRVPLEQVWGAGPDRLVESLAVASPPRRLELLATAVSQRRAAPDGLVAAAAQRLARPRTRVAQVAADLGVTDRPSTRTFYEQAFGWRVHDHGPAYSGIAAPDGEGEVGGLNPGAAPSADGPLVLPFSEDLDATVTAVLAAGGTVVAGPYKFPGGRRFEFTDRSGNRLGVFADPCGAPDRAPPGAPLATVSSCPSPSRSEEQHV